MADEEATIETLVIGGDDASTVATAATAPAAAATAKVAAVATAKAAAKKHGKNKTFCVCHWDFCAEIEQLLQQHAPDGDPWKGPRFCVSFQRDKSSIKVTALRANIAHHLQLDTETQALQKYYVARHHWSRALLTDKDSAKRQLSVLLTQDQVENYDALEEDDDDDDDDNDNDQDNQSKKKKQKSLKRKRKQVPPKKKRQVDLENRVDKNIERVGANITMASFGGTDFKSMEMREKFVMILI
jgi:hypothetical protein